MKKEEIRTYAKKLGAELVGFAPVSRWETQDDLPEEFFPQHIWPLSKTVIAMSVPSLLPVVETEVSHLYRSQYHNTNNILDETAYKLSAWLNRQGYASINISRDGYGYGTLQSNPCAAFSHVWAGCYAGLGTVGWNHTLLTERFGPRHRLVSVLTAVELEGDSLLEKELCIRCGLCEKACAGQAFSGGVDDKRSEMDRYRCMGRVRSGAAVHCGFCVKVCPVGEDRSFHQDGLTL